MKTCLICKHEMANEKYFVPTYPSRFVCEKCYKQLTLCTADNGNGETQIAQKTLAELTEKIKGMTKSVFWAGTTIFMVIGATLFLQTHSMRGIGLALLLAGPLLAWLASLVLYGIGTWLERSGYHPLMLSRLIQRIRKNKMK